MDCKKSKYHRGNAWIWVLWLWKLCFEELLHLHDNMCTRYKLLIDWWLLFALLIQLMNTNVPYNSGISFWWCVAYHFIPYRFWNLCGFLMHISCFPVDILIFYKEPFGPMGTLAAQVFGFIPFYFITGIPKSIKLHLQDYNF